MPTNTAGNAAREYPFQLVHYMSQTILFSDNGTVKTIGVVPAKAIILRGGIAITEAFNWGTNNLIDIGTSLDDDGFATDLSCATVGVIVADEMATSNDFYSTSAITVTCTPDFTGTQATTGRGVVWLEYIINNDKANAS